MPKTPIKNPFLPLRHPTKDFFICDIMNAVPKDDMASMEHPIFSLSHQPDTRIRYYEHKDASIQVTPSVLGLATIHDKDILIYCISQLMHKMNAGQKISRIVRLKAYDLLVATNRQTGGRQYLLLKNSFERLAGTRVTTNIKTNDKLEISGFGLIDSWRITAKDPKSSRMTEIEVTLSKWLFNSILGKELLSINPDYFRLRKPLERRIYELARKHCGLQKEWKISLDTLHKKCGSSSPMKRFRQLIKMLVEHNHLPDYTMRYDDDIVFFENRNSEYESRKNNHSISDNPLLKTETYERAKLFAPGLDIYYLEQEWLDFWHGMGKPELNSPDAAFIGFCKRRYEKIK